MFATALPPVLPAPVAAPVAAPAPGSPASPGNGPDSFARMLDAADARRQAQAAADETPEAPPAHKTAAQNQDGSAPAAEADAQGSGPAPDTATDGPAGVPAMVIELTTEQPGFTEPAPNADAAVLLAGLATLPRLPASDTAAAPTVANAVTRAGLRRSADAADDAGTRAQPRVTPEAGYAASAAPRRAGDAVASAAGMEAGQPHENFAQLMRQTRGDTLAPGQAKDTGTPQLQAAAARHAEAQTPGVDSLAPGVDALTPGAGMLATPAAPAVNHGTPTGGALPVGHARLAASPGSPEFAGQLGAQLTTFVREGVQHARLELHPQELGPVTVQIAIDGAQARVNLAAEHAATRQALEQAMPALAGSLREAGLTLSGGGVFEQPRQPQPDGGAATSEGRSGREGRGDAGDHAAGPDGSGAGPLAGVPLRRRGVVDLVA